MKYEGRWRSFCEVRPQRGSKFAPITRVQWFNRHIWVLFVFQREESCWNSGPKVCFILTGGRSNYECFAHNTSFFKFLQDEDLYSSVVSVPWVSLDLCIRTTNSFIYIYIYRVKYLKPTPFGVLNSDPLLFLFLFLWQSSSTFVMKHCYLRGGYGNLLYNWAIHSMLYVCLK